MIRKIRTILLLLIIIAGCFSCAHKNTVTQVSTIDALLAGVYDGDISFGELKKHGNFGLGTFNTLDGEMIAVDHQFYQIKADGIAYQVPDEMKAPFALVTYFEADQTIITDKEMDWDQLLTYLESLLPSENIPFAIRIEGSFDYMKTRSVPRQEKPYPPLLEVLEEQSIFEFEEIKGVMLGFRLPVYMDVANAPGYHFHFITGDRRAGGHVLDFQLQDLTVEIDYTDEWHVVLPGDDAFYHAEISGDDYQ